MAASPRYLRIAQDLASDIATGIYPVGSNLPTEAQLCEVHEISRFTAREALRCLVDGGMIQRGARVGSKVVSALPVGDYQPLASGPEDLVTLATGTRIVGGEGYLTTAGDVLAQRLGCKAGAKLFLYEGPRHLRNDSAIPLCWSEQYIPGRYQKAARESMVRGTFTADAAAKVRVEQVVAAELLSDSMAERLDAEAGSAALVIIRRHFQPSGEFYAAGVYTHPADRYQLTIPIHGFAAMDGEDT